MTIGDGSHTVFQELYDRNACLNRPFKKPPNTLRESISPKQFKLQISSTSGKCVFYFFTLRTISYSLGRSDRETHLSKDDVDMLLEKKLY